MINLLPENNKKQIRAARTNSTLIKYIAILSFAIVFLGSACLVSYIYLDGVRADAEKTISNNQNNPGTYSSLVQQATQINSSFSNAKNILSQQTKYSDILMTLGSLLPAGVRLDGINITNNSIGTPVELSVSAETSELITNLGNSFSESKMFTNYRLLSSTINNTDNSGYPVKGTINVTINRN